MWQEGGVTPDFNIFIFQLLTYAHCHLNDMFEHSYKFT